MKETPIQLDAHSVNMILQGKKTQLRCIYPQRTRKTFLYVRENEICLPYNRTSKGELKKWMPYGEEGDVLWVQERWSPIKIIEESSGNFRCLICYSSDRQTLERLYSEKEDKKTTFFQHPIDDHHFFPPLYMPRWASRLLLRTTNIRIERLQQIRDDECVKEGFWHLDPSVRKEQFRRWWDHTRGYVHDWITNPFVWVISFQVVESKRFETYDEQKCTLSEELSAQSSFPA